MTRYFLLEELKRFCEEKTARYQMPTAVQQGDACNHPARPAVHKMRLPLSREWKRYAPYILIQLVTGFDAQPTGDRTDSTVLIRFIFCVYNKNESEGSLDLINLMDTLCIALLEDTYVGRSFQLDREKGVETLIYPDDTAPYYAGEMAATFVIPAIKGQVDILWPRK